MPAAPLSFRFGSAASTFTSAEPRRLLSSLCDHPGLLLTSDVAYRAKAWQASSGRKLPQSEEVAARAIGATVQAAVDAALAVLAASARDRVQEGGRERCRYLERRV